MVYGVAVMLGRRRIFFSSMNATFYRATSLEYCFLLNGE